MILDNEQHKIKIKLDEILSKVNNHKQKSLLSKFFNTKENNNYSCIYIYGDVGRGKSKLMKDFFNSIENENKIYIHFNSFMIQLHESLHNIRQQKNDYQDELIEALILILKNNPRKNLPKIICFDEFQVNDIADAMLLSRIFNFIFNQQIIVIFTSNSHPLALYKNGLQRQLFLDFVNNILLQNCQILHLNSTIDYRSLKLANSFKKFLINNQANREIFTKYLEEFTKNKIKNIQRISVFGRELIIKNAFENIAVLSANELFFTNLHSSDYHQICKNFDLIFLKNLKDFSIDEVNEIKRFTLFIDEVYENKIALIILSKVRIDKLLDEELITNKFNYFARTISRLKEIKSLDYWQNSKFIGKNNNLNDKNIAL